MVERAADRPWRRDGAARYAVDRVRRFVRPPVRVTSAGTGLTKLADVEIATRDGTVLRTNVYLPTDGAPVPALLCAHPYGKDVLPIRGRIGGYRINPQYRVLRQSAPAAISDETGWEAPDPAWWTARGYALVNLDVRGAGHSDGVGSLFSAQEALDIHDAVEWIAAQPWCDGAVGMLGVSYLAISQYRAAATHPPHLRAIVPWEGFTNAYRDLFYPGGVREIGFSRLWTTITRHTTRMAPDVGVEASHRPNEDAWWKSLEPELHRIELPMLVCGSFSDNNLHTRGSFHAFAEVASPDRHLYTHRGGKWSTFYGDDAKSAQLAFLDTHLKGRDLAIPRVRLEVRERGDLIHQVRDEHEWPLARATEWMLRLGADGRLSTERPGPAASVTFSARRRAATFSWSFDRDTEITGPAQVAFWLRADRETDAHVFAGLSKWTNGRFVPFEGSYGFGRDLVTTGWRRARLDRSATRVEVELGPSATFFRAGDELRLHISGRQLSPRNPLFGAAPALYRSTRRAQWTIEWGPGREGQLTLPVIPAV
jgi:hypothetical protein